MNIQQERLEQLILDVLFMRQSVMSYDNSTGTWGLNVILSSSFFEADLEKLKAISGVEVSNMERSDNFARFDVRFTQPPRLVYGAEPDAELARLRAAGLALAQNAVQRDHEWGDYHCPNCGAETGYHASEIELKHKPDCPTRVFTEGGE